MANCNSHYNEYVKMFHELLALDSKFSNLDYLINYLLESDISDDQLAMSVQIFGSIYDSVNISKPNLLNLGKWKEINEDIAKAYTNVNLNSKDLSLDISNIVREAYNKPIVNSFYDNVNEILKEINSDSNIVNIKHVQELGKMFASELQKYSNDEERLNKIKENVKKVYNILLKRDKNKADIFNKITNYIEETSSKYIRLNSLNGINYHFGNKVHWILTNNHEQKYITIDNNEFYEVHYSGDEVIIGDKINPNDIKVIKWSRRSDEATYHRGEDGQTWMPKDTMSDGVILRPLDESVDGLNKFRTMTTTHGGIKRILAVRVDEESGARTRYIQNAIPNRIHETFETPGQEAYLTNNHDGVIVTVARPNEGIVFLAENDETTASVYGLSNFVFVSADNKTTKVDFSNPEHIVILKDRAVKTNNENIISRLTDSEILEMRRLSELYDKFTKEVEEQMGINDTFDATNIFDKYYSKELSNNTKELWSIDRSVEAVLEGKYANGVRQFDSPLSIVEINDKGEIVKEIGVKNVPFILYWSKDAGRYVSMQSIGANERISENEVLYTLDEYLAEKVINPNASKENQITYLDKITQIIKEKRNLKQDSIVIIKWSMLDGVSIPNNLQIVEMFPPSRSASNIAFTVGSLVDLINSKKENKQTKVREIGKNNFTFNIIKSLGKDSQYILNANFGTDLNTGELTIYLTPYSGHERYTPLFDKIKDEKVSDIVSFKLNEKEILNAFNELAKSEEMINFQKSVPSIHQSEVNTGEQINRIVKIAEGLNTNEAKALLVKAGELHDKLLSTINKGFVEVLLSERKFIGDKKEIKEKLYSELLNNLKKDFKLRNGNFAPQFMLFREIPNTDTPYNLNIHYIESGRRENNIENVRILHRPLDADNSLRIVPRTNVEVDSSVKEALDNLKLHKEISEAEEKISNNEKVTIIQENVEDELIDINDIENPYSGQEQFNEETTIADENQRRIEKEWLSENLTAELKEFKDLKINNNIVLGYVKDRIIHLNSQIKGKGTVYHEAFHYVFRYIFDKDTQAKLIREISNDKNNKSFFTKESINKFRKDRDISPATSNVEVMNLIAEEILADKFKDYALNEQKSKEKKSFIESALEFLKKILNFFVKKSSEIDLLFDKIYKGEYKNAPLSKNLTENEVAYLLVPTVRRIVNNPAIGKPMTEPHYLSSSEQEQLVNLIVAYMAKDKGNESFDEKFENASKKILEEVWSLDLLYSLNNAITENQRRAIRESMSNTISSYRFLLGDRLLENPTSHDINFTGNEKFNNLITSNYSIKVDGELMPNSNGEYSRKLLKEIVKKEYDKITTIESFIEIIEDIENNLEEDYNGEDRTISNDDNRFDSGISEFNVIKQNVGLIRKFLSTITYIKTNPLTGIKTIATANPAETFNTIVQATTNLSSKAIIPALLSYSEIIREDGHHNEANVIKAVYDALINLDGYAKDTQLMNLFLNVFETIELPYMFFSVNRNVNEMGISPFYYTLKDKLLENDLVTKKKTLYQEFANKNSRENQTAKYKQHAANLKTLINRYFKNKNLSVRTDVLTSSVDTIASNLSKSFIGIGLNIPKSSMKLSLLQHIAENFTADYNLNIPQKDKDFLNSFNDFIKEKQYFDASSLISFMNTFLSGDILTSTRGITHIVEPANKKTYESLKPFDAQFKKALIFMFQHDPKTKPSVSKNAEGKSIYRYVRPNPLSITVNKIRKEGLLEVLKTDELWDKFFKDFVIDDPVYGEYLKGELNDELELFFKNFGISLYGGVQQSENYKKFKKGKNYSDLDEQTLLLLNIAAFTKMEVHTSGKTTIQTFLKQYHQLESIGTNYFITSMYHKEHYLNDKRIQEVIKGKIKQEYNRIKREFSRAEENKILFLENKENNLIRNYNAKDIYTLRDGEIVRELVTDSPDLRAYNFNVMSDVFDSNEELKNELLTAAREQKDFEDSQQLDQLIKEYVKEQFNIFVAPYIKAGIVNENLSESTLLPTTMKVGTEKVSLKSYYSRSANPILSLFRDMFYNTFESNLTLNTLLDGDAALNIKNKTDLVKRLKKLGAAGSTLRDGKHKVLFLNTITEYIDENYPTYGPYRSLSQIENDRSIKDDEKRGISAEEVRTNIKNGFIDNVNNNRLGDSFQKTFDGQSISSIFHVIDMLSKFGRVNDQIRDLMIEKSFRELTADEMAFLNQYQVSFNSKKTVTSSRHFYLKLSEMTLDRNDVSLLWNPYTNSLVVDQEERENLYVELRALYRDLYNTKMNLSLETSDEIIESLNFYLKSIAEKIHGFFKSYPGREMRHNLLNTIEYYNIDQVVDTEASKNTTIYGLDLYLDNIDEKGYYNGDLHTMDLSNDSKYLQVETSGQDDEVSYSIQLKMLGVADLYNIDEVLEKENLTENEIFALKEINVLMHEHQKALKESAQSRLDYFQNVMRDGDVINMGELYNIISDSLTKQGASDNIIKFFKVDDVTGKPVFNSNFPIIKKMLTYYIFSAYSKNVTNEKITGKKYIHESAWNNKVIYNIETGRVIRRDEVQKSPDQYFSLNTGELMNGYATRELSVHKEVIDGVNHYIVETMIPMPLGMSEEEKDFYINNIMEGVGTRIPTEDKRSMVSFRVVDFLDSSKQNSFAMPYFAHILAGSDFDVDTLYTHHIAYFRDFFGKYKVYGEYSEGNEKRDKFLEYIHYLSEKPEISRLIKEYYDKHIGDRITNDYLTENIKNILSSYNIDVSALDRLSENTSSVKELDENISLLENQLNEDLIEEDIYEINDRLNYLKGIRAAANRVLRLSSIMYALHEKNLLNNPNYNLVSYVHQNKTIKTLGNILSNEAIFNNLYINKKSSTEAIKNALLSFGKFMKLENFVPKGNMYNPAFVVASKIINSSSKMGISQTASLNKFFALANQFNLKLNFNNVIWEFNTNRNDNEKVLKAYDTYGSKVDAYIDEALVDNESGVIEIIGNILGMFADAAKEPIPNALGLNEINTSVTLSMIGLGMPLEFAFGFNFIGSIRNAMDVMLKNTYGITESINERVLYFSNVLQSSDILNNEALRIKFENIDKSKLTITWNKPKGDGLIPSDVMTNSLIPSQIGYEVYYDNEILKPEEQEYILLNLYSQQVKQVSKLFEVNRGTSSLMKSLNPDIVAFNRIIDSLRALKYDNEKRIFTEDSIDRLFDKDKVFNTLSDVIDDLSTQLNIMFIERVPAFAGFIDIFSKYYESEENIVNRFIGFLALQSYSRTYMNAELNNDKISEYYKNYIRKDQSNLKKAFSSYGPYDVSFLRKLKEMQERFPDNEFLALLHVDNIGNGLLIEDKLVEQYIIRIFATMKLKNPEYASAVNNDLELLFKHHDFNVRLFINELFFKELARTGMDPGVTGTFLNFFPEMLKKVSQPLDKLMETILDKNNGREEIIESLKEIYNINTEKELNDLFSDLAFQMIYGANTSNVTNRGNINLSKIDSDTKAVVSIANMIFGNSLELSDKSTAIPLRDYNEDSLIMDFSNEDLRKSYIADVLASRMNIYKDYRSNEYTFPPIIKINNKIFVINKIDDESSKIGTLLLDAFVNRDNFELSGTKVEYINSNLSLESSKLSNFIHYTSDDIIRLNNYRSKNAKNVIEKNVFREEGFNMPSLNNVPIIDTEDITNYEGTKGAAKYDRKNNVIKVNRDFLKKKFYEKAWTKPRKLSETLKGKQVESYAQVLPENQFKTYEEWEQFVINHEYQHSLYSRQDFNKDFPNGTKGDYESEINRRALNQISKNTPQQKQQILTRETEDKTILKINKTNYSVNHTTGIITALSDNGNKTITDESIISKIYSAFAEINGFGRVEYNGNTYSKVFNTIINMETGKVITDNNINNLFTSDIKTEVSKAVEVDSDVKTSSIILERKC